MDEEAAIGPERRARSRPEDVDRVIAELAGDQRGRVARWQLLGRGVARSAIARRRTRTLFDTGTPGVYAVGSTASDRDTERMEAVLAAGPDAALGARSAGDHWEIREDRKRGFVVFAPRTLRPLGEVRRRCIVLPEDERCVHRDVPVTTVARTQLDLAASLSIEQLRRSITEGEVRRLGSRTPLPVLVDRYPRAPGIAKLRQILAELLGPTITRSELEILFLELLERFGLPRPLVNRLIEGYEVDMCWPDARVIVELDGWQTHGRRDQREKDLAKDLWLQQRGWTVIRLSCRQVIEEAARVAAGLANVLSRRAAA